ncbi:TonB-dependent receptor [Altericroceibacterium endophyticum]|uniref:TonB-dependent receptor n=1 Tax=Altericroceibacterium endophyticum TaxID=1808508 RepID=A0A6I4TAW3_9SPHN|nr:TonB-dependent receptor [Altericroceibacterium endophyticum]MXO67123.1 TonB-dependent receptor [Altericroceibacterium endophyticum]
MQGNSFLKRPRWAVGVSTIAMIAAPVAAWGQDAAGVDDEIVVSGIRASLRDSMNIKRDAQGVVDAISAEDIGKFPDTNLAESLQRITGVSIDRNNGEGAFVTVRGFGPEFNLVTLNGRQMPATALGGGNYAPTSRAFDFSNLASEGVSAIEVYKSGRADVPSGGIGSTIDIRTPRPFDNPDFHGSFSAKGMLDTSENHGRDSITPEFSGIVSDTFADGRIGILINGVYQKRKGANNNAYLGWRDGMLGSAENSPIPAPGTPGAENTTNPPGSQDVFAVPNNGGIGYVDFSRERINGQAVLQLRPSDSLTATLDHTYSSNKVSTRDYSMGIYFNRNDTASDWTDGPVSAPNFYTDFFRPDETKDLSYVGHEYASKSENNSTGLNLEWEPSDRLTFTLDAHHSIAESKPDSPYGSSNSVSMAIYGVKSQTIETGYDMPGLYFDMHDGIDALDPSFVQGSGNSFRNAYYRNRINQARFAGSWEGYSAIRSIDFGVNYIDNKIRSAYGYIQNNTWGGAGPASDIPDDLFHEVDISGMFPGTGSNNGKLVQSILAYDFDSMIPLLDSLYNVCGGTMDCLADYTTDRRVTEQTLAPFAQVNTEFELGGQPLYVTAGLRYEKTWVDSSALVPIPTGTEWVSDNEFNVIFSDDSDFTAFEGKYENWLPNIDIRFDPVDDVVLRASYSHTITRADYGSLQGGQTIDNLFRIDYGSGSLGNPGLEPYKSKNLDLSAEWYYSPSSYISVGYFRKGVENFLSSTRVEKTAFDLTNPASGPRYDAAIAALGNNATRNEIRQYIFANYPDTVTITGGEPGNYTGSINGTAEDDPVVFRINTPVNSDQTATLHGWEFALQHSFWETGFGVILNYTIVDGDAQYDNTQPASVTQFALTGLSNSANIVGFYDKDGLQARVAYNWRDEYLSSNGVNPTYVEAYGQLDASVSYDVTPRVNVFVEGINLTGESRRTHGRSKAYVHNVNPGFARYAAGVRIKI